jgi:site-specific DNA-methyltransferase (adenine-specific)
MAWLIKTYSNEQEVVLDNTMGEGSTGVACVKENRRFIGIEKELEYFNRAREDIDKTINDTKTVFD